MEHKKVKIQITREIILPDPIKLERFRKTPELGSKILFFSGGSALKKVCQILIKYTHNSIHIITAFDSGGSSAKLRQAFSMPAVGDVRNRLMSLADQSIHGNPEIYALFSHRFGKDKDNGMLREELERMVKRNHPLIARIPDPMRKIIKHHLKVFVSNMPSDFDLSGASIGNLVLTAGYMENENHLDPVIYIFSKLVQVRGIVRPIINRDIHLVTCFENGKIVVGQHLISGKESPPVKSKVKQVFLSDSIKNPELLEINVRKKITDLMDQAELICYPMGSFYSSLIANFLPRGVGKAICKNPCPKVFIPNTGVDPETYHLDVAEQTEKLLYYLRKDNPSTIRNSDVLNYVILDKVNGKYQRGINSRKIKDLGVEIINCPLVTESSKPFIDPEMLVPILITLA